MMVKGRMRKPYEQSKGLAKIKREYNDTAYSKRSEGLGETGIRCGGRRGVNNRRGQQG